MSDLWIVLPATVAIIALSAFFVIIEFALLGARRSRLEDAASTSRGARAALRSVNELTLMLAGAQLGITACTFALGAVTKPAFDSWFSALLGLVGLPYWLSDAAAFVLALLIVTFLHLVVGEMAPKSWAIAHPETSAILTGPPARAFIRLFRPLLLWVNSVANRLVKATGVEPVDHATIGGQDAATIRHLVEHSANVGALDSSLRTPMSGALDLQNLRIDDLLRRRVPPTAVAADATAADVQRAAERSGHMRILVGAEEGGTPGVVHVRDTLLAQADRPASDLARPVFVLPPHTPVYGALSRMRRASEQLSVVMDGSRILGVVTLDDALQRILPGHSTRTA